MAEAQMAGQWYYRMFGHDFGPVDFEELQQLAELGSITSADEVRDGESSGWVSAGSVGGLKLTAESVEAVASAPMKASATMEAPAASSSGGGVDQWFCNFHGQELGPLTFDELVEFAEQGQLTSDDEVKLGATGKWRRVGSIGRLVAVLPYVEPVKSNSSATMDVMDLPKPKEAKSAPRQQAAAPAPAPVPAAPAAAPAPVAPAPPAVPVPDPAIAIAELQKAQEAFHEADQNSKSMILWAVAPHVDPTWWGWIGGTEYGPVGFLQIYEWGRSGRLQPTDFVKHGFYGQYAPASNIPGLFNSIKMIKQAADALAAAQAKFSAVQVAAQKSSASIAAVTARPAPPPAPTPAAAEAKPVPAGNSRTQIPVPASSASIPAVPAKQVEETKPAAVAPAPTPAPAPSYTTASNSSISAMSRPMASSSGFSAPAAPRPAPPPVRPRSAPSGPPITDLFKDPKVQGGLGIVVAALLIVGWMYMPASSGKDIERYKELKKFLDDYKTARTSKKLILDNFRPRVEKFTNEMVPALVKEASASYPAKQSLLWAARDELPKMMQVRNLVDESMAEKNFAAQLKDAAKHLGIQ